MPDECHHVKAKTWEAILSRFPNARVLGLTATPARLDLRPLGDHFDYIVEGPSIKWLVAHGWLAPTAMKYVSRGIITTGVHKVAGDYSRKEMGEKLNRKVIAAPVAAFFQYARDRRVIFFGVNRSDSKAVAELFCSKGIRAVHLDGTTPIRERDQYMREFRDGEIQVLCNVDIVSEGTDVPMCDCVMMGLPTLSLTRYLQWAGRAMRPDHGRDALIIDLAENIYRHGRPDIHREWDLHTEQESGGAAPSAGRVHQRVCAHCATVYPAARSHCPSCGQEKVLETPTHIDVELIGDEPAPKPTSNMVNVRRDLRALIRNGGGRAGIKEIQERYGLNQRWEKNAIEALNL